jgi:hypothetical protein
VIEAVAVGTEASPVVETVALEAGSNRVDDVARAALDRAEHRDRGEPRAEHPDRKGRRDKRSEPTADTREFWETWAEEKSSRTDVRSAEAKPEPAPAARAEAETEPADAEAGEPEVSAAAAETETGGRRSRSRGDRDKSRSRHDTKPDRQAKDRPEKAERPGKPDRPEKADRDKPDRHGKAEPADKTERSRSKRDTVATPAATADGAQARLFVSLGKKHGVSADDLRALLAEPIGGDKSRIGSVSLRDSHAHVRVPEEYVDAIISGVHGTQHNDHEVTVERARA